MFKEKILPIFGVACIASTAAMASSVSSVDCTSPNVIVNFASAVTVSAAAADASTGLFYVGFEDGVGGTTVEINPGNGTWSSGNTTWTGTPTRKNYTDAANFDSWTLRIKTTADGTTASTACND